MKKLICYIFNHRWFHAENGVSTCQRCGKLDIVEEVSMDWLAWLEDIFDFTSKK